MNTQKSNKVLTRRTSKLLVELVIGIIGILGIMLAQVEKPAVSEILYGMQHKGSIASDINLSPEIDWLKILF